jgi:hypothetical protein
MMWQAGDIANAISITFILSNIKLAQGRLREPCQSSAIALAVSQGTLALLASDLYRGLQ